MSQKTLLGFNTVQGFLTRAVRELVMLDLFEACLQTCSRQLCEKIWIWVRCFQVDVR